MKIVSIIIPVYNVERYIRRCIDSVLLQTYSFIEVLLVDDGSTDASGVICDDYALKDTRVRVIHKNNEGVSIARNVGIKESQGDYITFLDADDLMKENCIANLMLPEDFPLVVGGYERFGTREGNDGPDLSQTLVVGKELADRWNKSADGWWWFVWGKLYRKIE